MASEQKSEFNYKPAFKLALLGNVILLGALMSFILKNPVEAVPQLQTRPGTGREVTRQLHMNYGDYLYVLCQPKNGKPSQAGLTGGTNPVLYCSDPQSVSLSIIKDGKLYLDRDLPNTHLRSD